MPSERIRTILKIAWKTVSEFIADGCPKMAAAISFYTLLSLPALLVLIILLIEPLLTTDEALRVLQHEVGRLIGPEGADQVSVLVENAARPGSGGPLVAALGFAAFVFGATAAFAQLQDALNAAWQVGPDPERGSIVNFMLKRLLSFGMILALGALLIASLILSAILNAFGGILEEWIPSAPSAAILRLLDAGISFGVLALLFTAMFRWLPDARVRLGAAFIGGMVTAVLFTTGKTVIAYYLGRSDPGNAYGAAGSLAMVLIWIYYSTMILLLGAEFTQIWMHRRGEPIEPVPGAVRVIRREERFEPNTRPTKAEGAKDAGEI